MIVYLLHCTTSGKCYVGQTRMRLDKRWWHHVKAARRGSSCALHAAIRKHGPEAFFRVELEAAASRPDLDQREIAAIEEFRTLAPHGYNLKAGGSPPDHSAETLAKIRAANLGRRHSAETLAKMRGRKHTAEELAKMSRAHAGYQYKPESLGNFGVAQRGRTYSAATLARMSAAARDRVARDGFAVKPGRREA